MGICVLTVQEALDKMLTLQKLESMWKYQRNHLVFCFIHKQSVACNETSEIKVQLEDIFRF